MSKPVIYSEMNEARIKLNEMTKASPQNIDNVLKQYFHIINRESRVGKALKQSLSNVNFDSWYQSAMSSRGSMVGSGNMDWPVDPEERISLQYILIESMAHGSINLSNFSHDFTYIDNNVNQNNKALIEQVFTPFHDDLYRIVLPKIEQSNPNNSAFLDPDALDDKPKAPTPTEVLVSNQAFIQAVRELHRSIDRAKEFIQHSNEFSIEHEDTKAEISEFLDKTKKRLTSIISEVDLSSDPLPVQRNGVIAHWVKTEWPESVEKLNEYTNKKALAEMLVPTGIVAAFGITAVIVGALFGVPPIVSFGTGSFIGMFATRQVTTKDASKIIQSSLDDTSSTDDAPH